ncbi:enoyl-CoA hydratase/isomerase family protein [Agromyces aerolatus]|uniref:enoyl-CoA hydratase/isomerase family protein n=1 Tax=Agromyces sp. LY-1074 TaxID=3074080 RepID=UPI00285F1A6C|nr:MULTISPECIES: enoyl-CoA hydratase/isomerase family protein [unclassified Agromyces]MDR5699752.1 enoyl-CoA hydratase/isomerase family protein [Agromyces sp. LY-1074]MDR5706048.1 enoyl-CoA hydratase/isomerase family protein [Agromyces sp. LY-1358]
MAVTRTGGVVATLTIDHPPVNTLSMATLAELDEQLEAIVADDRTRVLVLTGSGTTFASGGDVHELLEAVGDREAIEEHVGLTGRLFARLTELPFPTIAALDGHAVGGGLELAIACDLVIAAEHVRLGFPEVKLGLIPGAGGTQRLPRRVLRTHAAELLLTGGLIGGTRAAAIGLVNEAVGGSALERAHEIADRIAGLDASAVAAAKRALRAALELDEPAGLAVERDLFVERLSAPGTVEGLRAFLAGAR